MVEISIRELRPGATQSGVRAFNERLLLTLLHRHGPTPSADLAKRSELSAQTVSNIVRKLEADGLLLRGEPQRGRVGKPSIPMALNPGGALSFGMKIGRRSADLAVMNLYGEVLGQRQVTYRYPMPADIFGFLRDGMSDLSQTLTDDQNTRVCGIGIGAPFEIWRWTDAIGAPKSFEVWRDVDFAEEVAQFSDLPLFTQNDATAACRAEYQFGRGREFTDFAYFFVGSFIGGGIVMGSSVIEGSRNNAGALGSLRSGSDSPLLDLASIYLLEAEIIKSGADPSLLWQRPQDWSQFAEQLSPWVQRTANEIAKAARNACAVVDFEAVLIDGAFPESVRSDLVAQISTAMDNLDMRGIIRPRIEEARLDGNARVIGAAAAPIFSQFLLT
ncbi:MAG: ROK family transcriptional regulator [Pseudomonadota bacterium]